QGFSVGEQNVLLIPAMAPFPPAVLNNTSLDVGFGGASPDDAPTQRSTTTPANRMPAMCFKGTPSTMPATRRGTDRGVRTPKQRASTRMGRESTKPSSLQGKAAARQPPPADRDQE